MTPKDSLNLIGASFTITAERIGDQVLTPKDHLKILGNLIPEVRRYFEIEERLHDRETNFPTRLRPFLGFALGMIGISYVFTI